MRIADAAGGGSCGGRGAASGALGQQPRVTARGAGGLPTPRLSAGTNQVGPPRGAAVRSQPSEAVVVGRAVGG